MPSVIAILPCPTFPFDALAPAIGDSLPTLPFGHRGAVTGGVPAVVAAVDPDEEEDLGDEEDLAVAQPPTDEESNFDDFDDEFDDDFEEDPTDPDWDHPDEGDAEPPPGKSTGRKK